MALPSRAAPEASRSAALAARSTGSCGHLYVHVPYCRDRCTYCAFPTTPDRRADHEAFCDAIVTEAHLGPRLDPLATVYLGGGTPALLKTTALSRLLGSVKASPGLEPDCEITLEANPANVSAAALRDWSCLGITRISLGIQTFDDASLRKLARLHDGRAARAALELIASDWPHTWSADLLVGWPGQTAADLDDDLALLLRAGPPHVSVYGLTAEAGTAFTRPGGPRPAPAARLRGFDDHWSGALEDAGLERYEVSNFARPGHRSRHNQAYWTGRAVLGLGPGAASSIGTLRWSNRRDTSEWMKAVMAGHSPRDHVERLGPERRLVELLGAGLRTRDGLSTGEIDRRFSPTWRAVVERAGEALLAKGLLRLSDGNLCVPARELARVDAILAALMADWPLDPSIPPSAR